MNLFTAISGDTSRTSRMMLCRLISPYVGLFLVQNSRANAFFVRLRRGTLGFVELTIKESDRMALQGKFIVNDADFSPLMIYGVGTFMAFSGDGIYRNRGGCGMIPDKGPIPRGKYWIVDRPEGNWKNRLRSWAIDIERTYWDGVPTVGLPCTVTTVRSMIQHG